MVESCGQNFLEMAHKLTYQVEKSFAAFKVYYNSFQLQLYIIKGIKVQSNYCFVGPKAAQTLGTTSNLTLPVFSRFWIILVSPKATAGVYTPPLHWKLGDFMLL